jgi:hypothetical protein
LGEIAALTLDLHAARCRRKKMVMLACCAMILVAVVAGPVLALFVPDI